MADQIPKAKAYFVAVPPITGEPISTAIFILIDVGAFIAGLLGFCGGWQAAVKGLAQSEQTGFDNTASTFAWMAGFTEGLFRPLADLFKSLWNLIIVGILGRLLKAIQAMHKWLEAKLGPLIKAIKQYQQSMQRLFNTYIKPLLNVIQNVRRFLQLLRSLGLKWAGVLDTKLLKIEAAITGVFLRVASVFNGIVDLLNAISDPMGLLRRPTLLLSLRRVFNGGFRMFTGLPVGYFLPSPAKGRTGGTGLMPADFTPDNLSENPPASFYLTGDDGLLDFGGMGDSGVMPDGLIDNVGILDYFNPDLYPPPPCESAVDCAIAAWNAQVAQQALVNT